MSEARDNRTSEFRQDVLPGGPSGSRQRSNDLGPTTPYVSAESLGPAPGERRFVLSMLPADRRERVRALAVVLVSSLVFVALAPFARVPLGRLDAFIPSYQSALAVNDLITAALLFGQFATLRSRALLVLASGYLFTAFMAVAHALTFPGLFSPTGLLGAGPQTTAWLYMFWHAGFPLAVIAYAWLERGTEGMSAMRKSTRTAIAGSAACVLAVVCALTLLATAGAAALPAVMAGNGYTDALIVVISTVWLFSLAALLALWRRRPHSVLDLWLMVVLCAWLFDIALSAVLNAGRFDLGFYAGRIYGLMAASFVLLVLLLETGALYARLARSLEKERLERERRLSEVEAELRHVARVAELGQMVSALTHEIAQPLFAIGNYVRVSQRLAKMNEPGKVDAALQKAVDQVARANHIVQRLRDFLKKTESGKQAECLPTTIEEACALALSNTKAHKATLEARLDPAAASAVIDRIQIQQVLLNLIRNASEAMAESDRRDIVIATAPSSDRMIEVSVADTGPGLSSEVRERLFQPFVTTKASGMGVGLSICRGIVDAHGGRMWAEANPGGGTVFRFTLPSGSAL
jgi:two-component system, sensor histidine kinase and response regulator